MSLRRPHKKFPAGTFIPTPMRLVAIVQLCLAFSLLLWYLTQPYMGEYFNLRSRMLLYEYVMGTSKLLQNQNDQKTKLERQVQRFQKLLSFEQQWIKEDYQNLQTYANRSILKKLLDGFRVLIQKIPPFEQAWIFFSITIAILILLKKEGSKHAAWILPLIVIAYAIDNQLTGKAPSSPPDYFLFPTEETLIKNYFDKPLASKPLEQKSQLEEGWKKYLIDHWSLDSKEEDKRLEEAEFNFTLARLKILHTQPFLEWSNIFHEKLGVFSLFLYLAWNGLFAVIINRSKNPAKKLQDCLKIY